MDGQVTIIVNYASSIAKYEAVIFAPDLKLANETELRWTIHSVGIILFSLRNVNQLQITTLFTNAIKH